MTMNQAKPTPITFAVTLFKNASQTNTIDFHSTAKNSDQAKRQAASSYPGCIITSCLPYGAVKRFMFSAIPAVFVIYSPNESATNDGRGFWSNEQRSWVEFDQATKFSDEQRTQYNPHLTIALGGDDRWVPWEEANAHYGQSVAAA